MKRVKQHARDAVVMCMCACAWTNISMAHHETCGGGRGTTPVLLSAFMSARARAVVHKYSHALVHP